MRAGNFRDHFSEMRRRFENLGGDSPAKRYQSENPWELMGYFAGISGAHMKVPGRPKAVLGERFWGDINVRGGVIAVNACDSGSWEVVVQIWVGMGKGECKGKGRMKMKIQNENEDWDETLWRG